MPADRQPYPTAAAFMPPHISLPALREAAGGCQGCPLYQTGTQTVFGEGPKSARLMFIGEQPGDQEDKAGRPFVGPSGKLLDQVLDEVGIDRGDVYVTNAVKHFKWEPRGKRRIHSKPSSREIGACKPWPEAELKVVRPQVIVCLGATAAHALLGSAFRLTRHRGEFQQTPHAPALLATVHPSAILRMPDPAARDNARRQFADDLGLVAQRLAQEQARAQRKAGAREQADEHRPPAHL